MEDDEVASDRFNTEMWTRVLFGWTSITKEAAAGQLRRVQWLHARGVVPGCTKDAMDEAQECCRLKRAQWFQATGRALDVSHVFDHKAQGGYLAVVQCLYSCRDHETTWAMECAAMNGHLEVVQWLHENRKEKCTSVATDMAAMTGRLEVVKWLQANCTEGCTANTVDEAIMNGHVHIVQWLRDSLGHVTCSREVKRVAAARGHVNMVGWLHDHGSCV